jgi:hypothetical protein
MYTTTPSLLAEMGVSITFLPRVGWNCEPPNIHHFFFEYCILTWGLVLAKQALYHLNHASAIILYFRLLVSFVHWLGLCRNMKILM